MLRIDRKLSVTLSYAFCGAAFVGVLLLGVLLACGHAFFPDSLLSAFLTAQKKAGISAYVLEYLILALVLFSDVCLMLLLNHVRMGAIFTDKSVAYLRMISWASILAGVCAIPLYGMLHLLSALFVSFVAFFLGIVLRVVKNVIEEGTVIKEENDSTI